MNTVLIDSIEYSKDLEYCYGVLNHPEGKDICLNENTKIIDSRSFDNEEIGNMIVSNNLNYISEHAFIKTKLKSLEIKNPVILEQFAFQKVKAEKILLNTKVVPYGCFMGAALSDMELKNTVSLEGECFANAVIKKITLPDTLQIIKESAFGDAVFENTKFIVPGSVTHIYATAFRNTNITNIYLPDNLEFLDPYFGGMKPEFTVHASDKIFKKFDFLKKVCKIKVISLDEIIENSNSFKEINNIYKQKEKTNEKY